MVDASVMRSLATRANLQALTGVKGVREGAICILPLHEQDRALVLAYAEGASPSDLDKVVSRGDWVASGFKPSLPLLSVSSRQGCRPPPCSPSC